MSLVQPSAPATVTIQAYRHTCRKCDHVWTSELERPAKCPACRNPKWEQPLKWSWSRSTNRHHREARREHRHDTYHYPPKHDILKELNDDRRRTAVIYDWYKHRIPAKGLITFNMPKEQAPPLYEGKV